ncbi:phosphate acetyltransferase [Microvirga mediterraneensis]|uniref:Phosphate acetyltransferase n=1 Tax=Microvirga mediterraneensis TaxID=2754695 RepID=A0A838BPM0_9HYPH|nr:phosphate acetyltransferase [Microvirga mediterraneensis]MBA1156852.1 phosphate acetyltransferase [Microvirga mediterraneensis]
MKPLEAIINTARTHPQRIVLAEGEDDRIVAGALRAAQDGIAQPILVGRVDAIRREVERQGGNPAAVTMIDPAMSERTDAYVEEYLALRRQKGVDADAAVKAMRDPLGYSAMMVRKDDADGTIGGAIATTADTVRAALQIIGRAPESAIVSSFFLMMFCEPHHLKKGVFVFADCGLVVEPDATQLADIAINSARSYQALTGLTPKVAMLSFSTNGSAKHERVSRVVEAARIASASDPSLLIDGELQFDAAFVEAVNAVKAPGSATGGAANVMVFPNLESANIGYKIAQRIGGAKAIGPILQGLAKPANDLSRGCSAEDVYHMIAITSLQASRQKMARENLERRQAEALCEHPR